MTLPADSDLDLLVIGSGGAAMAAGIEARRRGKSVLLVEEAVLGGTCLNRGCVPSKRLLAAAGHRHAAARQPFAGISSNAGPVDLPKLLAAKVGLVDQLRASKYAEVAAAHGFEVRHGHARFTDRGTVSVDGQSLRAAAYLIATGARPAIPDLPGITEVDVLTSTTAMELEELPGSLVVIGAGYVGLEQAQLWSRLGVPVTLVGRFAPHTEPELAQALKGVFAAEGISVVEDRAVAVEATTNGFVLSTRDGRQVRGKRLLVATGRTPNTADLGLAAAGVRTDEGGFITVDTQQRTSNPRIFAAGDVTGAPQYVYVAAKAGHVAAAGALGEPTSVDYAGLPAVTFTTPQLGSAGLTEAQALARGHRCDSRILGAQDIPRALVNGEVRGALKLVVDVDTRRVLGVHAALDGAGELLLAATYAITNVMTVEDVHNTWAPYLTMAEALKLAAGLFLSELPTSCCA